MSSGTRYAPLTTAARALSSSSARRTALRSFVSSRCGSPRMASTRQRPANWKALAPAPLPGTTFAAQANLPRLPVPPLKDTLDTLKETLKPIAWDESEYATALRKVDEFARGPAEELQRRLTERQAKTEHWLEEWWDDGAYLTYRDSVSIFSCHSNVCLITSRTRSVSMYHTIVSNMTVAQLHPHALIDRAQMASMHTRRTSRRHHSIVQHQSCARSCSSDNS